MLLIGFISCLTYRKSSIFLCSYTAHDYYRKSQNILRCIFLYLLIFVRPFYFVLKNKNWLIIIFAKQRQQIIMMVFSLLIDKIAKITKKCTLRIYDTQNLRKGKKMQKDNMESFQRHGMKK